MPPRSLHSNLTLWPLIILGKRRVTRHGYYESSSGALCSVRVRVETARADFIADLRTPYAVIPNVKYIITHGILLCTPLSSVAQVKENPKRESISAATRRRNFAVYLWKPAAEYLTDICLGAIAIS